MTVRIGFYTAVERPDGGHRAARSAVWRGEDEAGSPVCLLLVPVGDAGGVARAVAVAAAVTHRHLLPVIDVVTDAEQAAVVAGWPRGGRLLELVRRRGPLPAEVTLTVLLPLASALAAIHRSGMRHGGVGAGSVFFDDDGRPLLGALAISTIVSEGNGGLPRESWDVAPELVRGERLTRAPVTPAADIFSLGSVALYCLTGAPAWPADDPADVLIQSAAGVWPEPPHDAGPPALIEVIRRMLLDDPAARPTADELVGLLAKIGPPSPVPVTARRGRATAAGARWAGRSAEPMRTGGADLKVPVREGTGSDSAFAGDGWSDGAAVLHRVGAASELRAPIPEVGATVSDSAAAAGDSGDTAPAGGVMIRGRLHRKHRTGGRASASGGERPQKRRRTWRDREALRRGAGPDGWPGRRPLPAATAPAGSPSAASRSAEPLPAPSRAVAQRSGGPSAGPTPLARAGIAVLSVVLTVVVALQVWVWWTGVEESGARGANSAAADPNVATVPSGSVPAADQDWLTVVRALDAARGSAVAAADPAQLDRVYITGSAAADADAATIRSLAQRGWRVNGGQHVIDEVAVIGPPAPWQSTGAAAPTEAPSASGAPPTQSATAPPAGGPAAGSAAVPASGETTIAATVTARTRPAGPAAAGTASAAPTAVRVAVRGSLPAYPVLDAEGRHVADTTARPAAEWILTLAATDVGYRISAVERG